MFVTFFNKSDVGFHLNVLPICFFTNTINNSAQLKNRELRLLVLFLLIILEMHSSAALECAGWVCFLKTVSLGKNLLKIVKPWEMKKLLWGCQKDSETVWQTVKPRELRGLLICKSENYKLSEVLKPMSALLDHIKSRWGNFS